VVIVNGSPRALAAIGAAVLVLCLSSCGALVSPRETVLPTAVPSTAPTRTDAPSPVPTPDTSASAVPDADGAQDCRGVPFTVPSATQPVVVVGDCPVVRIAGAGLAVDTTGADVDAIEITGDRMVVTAGDVPRVAISGQDNAVDAVGVAALTVNGDRNTVTADDAIDSITIAGNDNRITGGTLGAVSSVGQRNTVSPR
jgi:hypothetical protein